MKSTVTKVNCYPCTFKAFEIDVKHFVIPNICGCTKFCRRLKQRNTFEVKGELQKPQLKWNNVNIFWSLLI